MNTNRFPDFGQEVLRPFKVCEHCYGCVEFHDGCDAWPESKPFRCADYHRLPDVMPGTCGQHFPPSRMGGRKEPRELPTLDTPLGSTGSTAANEPRRCGCGEMLAKGRRLCDECRIERRRQAKRGYMKSYMQQRRSAASASVTDMPSASTRRPRTRLVSDDLPATGTTGEGRLF